MTGSVVRPLCLGDGDEAVELAAERELVAEQGHAALEGQRGQGHPPAVADLADDVVDGGAGAVEEDLVELGGAGQLGDGPDLDAGLVHGHEQVGQALVPGRARVGAADDEAPVGLVGERRPHLLAGDDPLVPVEHGPGLDVGQVAAGVGLGVALAPELGALTDGREEAVPSARAVP